MLRRFGLYNLSHIRPLAVRPLTHPERVPNPWGFSISGSPEFSEPASQAVARQPETNTLRGGLLGIVVWPS
jgi:hypothetical protein